MRQCMRPIPIAYNVHYVKLQTNLGRCLPNLGTSDKTNLGSSDKNYLFGPI